MTEGNRESEQRTQRTKQGQSKGTKEKRDKRHKHIYPLQGRARQQESSVAFLRLAGWWEARAEDKGQRPGYAKQGEERGGRAREA